MINAVGLANPGVEEVRGEHLPGWQKSAPRKGDSERGRESRGRFREVVVELDDFASGFRFRAERQLPERARRWNGIRRRCAVADGGGYPRAERRRTENRPVKLSPTLPDIGRTAAVAGDAGADGISVVNTLPGLLIDVECAPTGAWIRHRWGQWCRVPPRWSARYLSGEQGGQAAGHRDWRTRGTDIVQYVLAGASLVAIGTAAMQEPRAPEASDQGAGSVVWVASNRRHRRLDRYAGVARVSRGGVSSGLESSDVQFGRAVPIVALDFPDADTALQMVSRLGDSCRFYKVGSELFTAEDPLFVERIRREGCDVFLDLKLHDIPNTVAGAMQRISSLGVRLATVHASGKTMVEAAVEAAGPDCGVLAVTILTSLDGPAMGELVGTKEYNVGDAVLRLAGLAASAGARGIVCSGSEARPVRTLFGRKLDILVPGIRLAGDSAGDQARVVTPEAAARAGANYVVLGRSVTAASDPTVRHGCGELTQLRKVVGTGVE